MILHVDMDAFFASVERLDRPELVGRPLVVGGDSPRGVVAAASYEARAFGIRSAMPMFQARKRCPALVVVAPRRSRYQEVSRQVMAILECYAPAMEQVSIDEAYLDVSGCERLYGEAPEIARRIKADILAAVGLTCSVGVAPGKMLAKVASDMHKPDGLTVVSPEEAPVFMAALPVGKIPGVGEVTRRQLEAVGIRCLGDVQNFPQDLLTRRMGKFGRRLIELSRCIDNARVTPISPAKSVSAEQTLAADTLDAAVLDRHLLRHAEDVARQLRKLGVKAKIVVLKIKYADFSQITRQTALSAPTNSAAVIHREAAGLLEALQPQRDIRLAGVGAAGLIPADTPQQCALFGTTDGENGWCRVDRALDAIAERFGKNAVRRACLVQKQGSAERPT